MADLTTSQTPSAFDRDTRLDRAADAALRLAKSGGWRAASLRDIAAEADLPFVDLYASAPDKGAVLDRISRRFDEASLRADVATTTDAGDRLFEAMMARLEAMEPERFALTAIFGDEAKLAPRLGLRFAATAKALLEAAGVDTGGPGGAFRVAAMTTVWLRILQVWRDDEGALNRTMAEIDKRVKQLRKRLGLMGLGF